MLSLLCRVLKVWLLSFLVVSMCIFNIPISSMAESAGQKENVLILEPMKIKEGGLEDHVSEVSPAIEIPVTDSESNSAVDGTIPASSIAESVEQNESVPVLEPNNVKEKGTEDQISDISPAGENIDAVFQTETTADGADSHGEDADSIDGLTMLYIGGAVAGVAVLAAALGANSGSSGSSNPVSTVGTVGTVGTSSTSATSSTSSSSSSTSSSSSSSSSNSSSSSSSSYPEDLPPVPEPTSVVGPNLNGSDWTGYLDIEETGNEGYQRISARIDHSGSSVQIYTSSTLNYGRKFSGTISSSGYMLMYDSVTGEDWTTHKGNARSGSVDLYDYVNDFDDLDRMYLSR